MCLDEGQPHCPRLSSRGAPPPAAQPQSRWSPLGGPASERQHCTARHCTALHCCTCSLQPCTCISVCSRPGPPLAVLCTQRNLGIWEAPALLRRHCQSQQSSVKMLLPLLPLHPAGGQHVLHFSEQSY